ncbi:CCA tRNA nucleotidyltransferase [Oscillibacter sp. MSJ-31]|uniref:CCA tRNA nucleotidyltransferase n=1 Tax=Oscillibacter sp. MSJ-31 TaxID=2841526 RepID=UPI00209FBB45|nr:HD domain-containing protein [Oscillibacter sp. MSJ-31]
MMKLPPQVNTVFLLLDAAGYEAFLVGGAVRDYVRDGSPAKDWDITTNALPEQVEAVFSDYHLIETGLKHGTVTVVIDHEPIEITTYRIDGDYSDHRHPDSVSFTRSLKDDLERRDFTMNALAYSPKDGVVDLVGGKADIENGIVRCVGDPDRRFQEDGLRMLRALRFSSVYGMEIDEATASAIHRNKNLLRDIAAERIQTELTKMLCGPGIAAILREFADVIAVAIPEIRPMFGFEQRNPHHNKDIWNHTILVVDSITPAPVLRWAALLHDIGKPSCFSIGADGVGHFFGHAEKSTAFAEAILSRLRFDNAGRERILRLIRYHDMPITADRKLIKRLLSKHGEEAARQLIELHRADTLGLSESYHSRVDIFKEANAVMDELLREDSSCFTLRDLAINGNDVMAMGFKGKQIGLALQSCLDAVLEERIPNERGPLLSYAQEHNAD